MVDTVVNPEQEFDDLMAAVASNDHEALQKLMDQPTDAITATPEVPDENNQQDGKDPVVDTPVVADEPTNTEPKVEPVMATPEAELEQLRQEVHRLRSDAGRVPFTQRRIKELETEVATLRATQATRPAASDASGVETDPDLQNILEDLKAVDPAVAKAIELAYKKSVANSYGKVDEAFNAYGKTAQESEDERLFAEQWAVLQANVPQAKQIFASNEWQQWKQGLSPGRRAMAESVYADEVITAIHAFAADMQRFAPQPQATQVAQPQQPVVSDAAQQAINERNRKMNTAAEITTSAAKASEDFDENAAYLELYNKIAKANHIK